MCVGRAVRCACVAPTPKAQVFADRSRLQQKKNSIQSTRVSMMCCSSRQSTRRCHRCCICTLPTLHRMSLPAFAAASMAVNRRQRGAMDNVCVGRALRCSDMRVSPQSPQHDDDWPVVEKKNSTQRTRVTARSTRRSHGCCICTLSTLRRVTSPTLAAASRRHGFATGPALRER